MSDRTRENIDDSREDIELIAGNSSIQPEVRQPEPVVTNPSLVDQKITFAANLFNFSRLEDEEGFGDSNARVLPQEMVENVRTNVEALAEFQTEALRTGNTYVSLGDVYDLLNLRTQLAEQASSPEEFADRYYSELAQKAYENPALALAADFVDRNIPYLFQSDEEGTALQKAETFVQDATGGSTISYIISVENTLQQTASKIFKPIDENPSLSSAEKADAAYRLAEANFDPEENISGMISAMPREAQEIYNQLTLEEKRQVILNYDAFVKLYQEMSAQNKVVAEKVKQYDSKHDVQALAETVKEIVDAAEQNYYEGTGSQVLIYAKSTIESLGLKETPELIAQIYEEVVKKLGNGSIEHADLAVSVAGGVEVAGKFSLIESAKEGLGEGLSGIVAKIENYKKKLDSVGEETTHEKFAQMHQGFSESLPDQSEIEKYAHSVVGPLRDGIVNYTKEIKVVRAELKKGNITQEQAIERMLLARNKLPVGDLLLRKIALDTFEEYKEGLLSLPEDKLETSVNRLLEIKNQESKEISGTGLAEYIALASSIALLTEAQMQAVSKDQKLPLELILMMGTTGAVALAKALSGNKLSPEMQAAALMAQEETGIDPNVNNSEDAIQIYMRAIAANAGRGLWGGVRRLGRGLRSSWKYIAEPGRENPIHKQKRDSVSPSLPSMRRRNWWARLVRPYEEYAGTGRKSGKVDNANVFRSEANTPRWVLTNMIARSAMIYQYEGFLNLFGWRELRLGNPDSTVPRILTAAALNSILLAREVRGPEHLSLDLDVRNVPVYKNETGDIIIDLTEKDQKSLTDPMFYLRDYKRNNVLYNANNIQVPGALPDNQLAKNAEFRRKFTEMYGNARSVDVASIQGDAKRQEILIPNIGWVKTEAVRDYNKGRVVLDVNASNPNDPIYTFEDGDGNTRRVIVNGPNSVREENGSYVAYVKEHNVRGQFGSETIYVAYGEGTTLTIKDPRVNSYKINTEQTVSMNASGNPIVHTRYTYRSKISGQVIEVNGTGFTHRISQGAKIEVREVYAPIDPSHPNAPRRIEAVLVNDDRIALDDPDINTWYTVRNGGVGDTRYRSTLDSYLADTRRWNKVKVFWNPKTREFALADSSVRTKEKLVNTSSALEFGYKVAFGKVPFLRRKVSKNTRQMKLPRPESTLTSLETSPINYSNTGIDYKDFADYNSSPFYQVIGVPGPVIEEEVLTIHTDGTREMTKTGRSFQSVLGYNSSSTQAIPVRKRISGGIEIEATLQDGSRVKGYVDDAFNVRALNMVLDGNGRYILPEHAEAPFYPDIALGETKNISDLSITPNRTSDYPSSNGLRWKPITIQKSAGDKKKEEIQSPVPGGKVPGLLAWVVTPPVAAVYGTKTADYVEQGSAFGIYQQNLKTAERLNLVPEEVRNYSGGSTVKNSIELVVEVATRLVPPIPTPVADIPLRFGMEMASRFVFQKSMEEFYMALNPVLFDDDTITKEEGNLWKNNLLTSTIEGARAAGKGSITQAVPKLAGVGIAAGVGVGIAALLISQKTVYQAGNIVSDVVRGVITTDVAKLVNPETDIQIRPLQFWADNVWEPQFGISAGSGSSAAPTYTGAPIPRTKGNEAQNAVSSLAGDDPGRAAVEKAAQNTDLFNSTFKAYEASAAANADLGIKMVTNDLFITTQGELGEEVNLKSLYSSKPDEAKKLAKQVMSNGAANGRVTSSIAYAFLKSTEGLTDDEVNKISNSDLKSAVQHLRAGQALSDNEIIALLKS